MTSPPDAPESDVKGGSFFWLWMLMAALVVYALSVGPAVRIAMAYPATVPGVQAAYAPLVLFANQSKPVEGFFKWYVGTVWGVK